MNPAVAELFVRLTSNEESSQNHAVAELAMLFEQSIYVRRHDPAWAAILPDNLLGVRLPPSELKEALDEAISLAESEQLYRSSRLCLIGVIARSSSIENTDVLLKWFAQFAETFNEQEAYSFLAEFSLFLMGVRDMKRIEVPLQNYGTITLLEKMRAVGTPRLKESATRVLNYMRRE